MAPSSSGEADSLCSQAGAIPSEAALTGKCSQSSSRTVTRVGSSTGFQSDQRTATARHPGWARRLSLWLAVALIPAFSVGIFIHFKYVKPVETRLLAEEARSLAREIDTVLKARDAAIDTAVTSLDPGQELSSAALERLVRGFQRTFPDFLSLEIANDRGELQAMIGELSLSRAARPGGDSSREGKAESSNAAHQVPFSDDPSSAEFFICREARSPEGLRWFARARFSRTAIENILGSASQGRTFRLVPSTHRQSEAPTGVEPFNVDVLGLRHDSGFAEAPLASPGWLARVERPAAAGPAGFLAAGMAGSLLLVSGLLALPVIVRRLHADTTETSGEYLGLAAGKGAAIASHPQESFPTSPVPRPTAFAEDSAVGSTVRPSGCLAAGGDAPEETLSQADHTAETLVEDYSIEEILGRPEATAHNAARAHEAPDVAATEEPACSPLGDGIEEIEISAFIHEDFSDLEDPEQIEITVEYPAVSQNTVASQDVAGQLEPPEVLEVEWMESREAPEENLDCRDPRKYSGA